MRATLALLVIPAVLAAGLTARADEDYVSAQALFEAGLAKYWQLALPLDKGQTLSYAFRVDDTLYLGTQDGFVFAVHAYTGVTRWLQPVTRSGYALRRPCHAGDQVYFTTPVDIQIYDRRTGEPVARHELKFAPGSSSVSDGKRLFLGGVNRRLYAMDAETTLIDWQVLAPSAIRSTPTIHEENLYFACDTGQIFAATLKDKVAQWDRPASTYGPVTADLVVDDRGVFVACRDSSLYLFDLAFGELRWRARLAAPLDDPPVLAPELAYQYDGADGIAAVEANPFSVPERIRWRQPRGRYLLTQDAKSTYVLSRDEALLVIDPNSGEVQHEIAAPGFKLGVDDIAHETLFMISPDGRIFCARGKDAKPLSREDILAAYRGRPEKQQEAVPGVPTTQPAVAEPDLGLDTQRTSPPIGGESEVSKKFNQGGSGS